MASFARPALLQREWTVEEHELFAARKEFELLKLLSRDRKALATARRLGFTTSAGKPHSHNAMASGAAASAAPSTAGADVSSAPSDAMADHPPRRAAPRARRPQPQSHQPKVAAAAIAGHGESMAAPTSRVAGASPARSQNARQRRSSARSARHYARRRQAARLVLHSRTLAVLFALKLRRLARLRRDLRDLDELSDAAQTGCAQLLRAPTAKRGPGGPVQQQQ